MGSKVRSIGFLGGGKMAQAIGNGFIKAGLVKGANITASVHPSDTINMESFKSLGATVITNNVGVVEKSDVLFMCVKPSVMSTVLNDIKSNISNKLCISIAMGITVDTIESNLNKGAKVIRVMPNTPALIQEACSVLVRGTNVTDSDVSLAETLMKAVGSCEEVDESHLDAVTALSGSGPAYVFVMIEALADGGVRMGLPRDLAYRLAAQTVLGSGQMVRDSGLHPAKLKDDVCSPGGSTSAGLRHLEKQAFRAAVAGAVEEATLRCKEVSAYTGK